MTPPDELLPLPTTLVNGAVSGPSLAFYFRKSDGQQHPTQLTGARSFTKQRKGRRRPALGQPQ